MLNKGAMFGLDARIALAIFGALSVISGAALYSAIQDSKATAIITELQEVGKAYDQYYLDTGKELTFSDAANSTYLDIRELVSSTDINWKGPYLQYEISSIDTFSLTHNLYDRVRISEMLDGTWTANGNSSTWQTTVKCDTGTVGGSCNIWTVFRDVPLNIYNAIDEKIDGSVDTQNGNVRMITWSGIPNLIFIKYRPQQS
jgi:Tfp pilus assembly protein PilE